jgi:ribosomal protein S18 acetylase RimI-like enzyme
MVTVARAEASDFLDIAALDRVAWRRNRHSEFIPDGEHVWRIWVEHALVFCARDETRLVGAILAFPCLDQTWCVHKVFVAPEAAGQGTGSRLMETLLTEIDRRRAVCFLTVDPTNEPALRLYERWGFRGKRLVNGFYRAHEDRYVLTRQPQDKVEGGR